MFPPRIWIICRVCMEQKHGMVDLFSEVREKPVWGILRECANIPVSKGDNLPERICKNCIERLWKAHEFRLDCQRAHRQITELVPPIEKEFQEGDKPISLDEYHQRVIERFQMENDYHRDSSDSLEDTLSSPTSCAITDSKAATNCSKSSRKSLNVDDTTAICKDDQYSTRPLKKRIVWSYKNGRETVRRKSKLRPSRLELKVKTTKKTPSYFTCNICNNVYSSAVDLRHHKYVHRRPHQCNICGKEFGQRQQFNNHKNSHFGDKPYPCRMCSRSFADTSNRNKHERNVHKRSLMRELPKRVQCLICKEIFKTTNSLREHHRSVHEKELRKKYTN
ncbi:uncharacterized protein [Musca autumnalis]|uniref:uncharacterized protein n=1 Tax=Musca autumnalis TaxID=221902 RepID=UPI003CF76E89